jgi:hypothetical protein
VISLIIYCNTINNIKMSSTSNSSNDAYAFDISKHQKNYKMLFRLGLLFMLAECISNEESPMDRLEIGYISEHINMYYLLHGYRTQQKIPKNGDSKNIKRRRDGSYVRSLANTRYVRHSYSYDGFYYNYIFNDTNNDNTNSNDKNKYKMKNNDNDKLWDLKSAGKDVKELIPYVIFTSYMDMIRKWKQQINVELNTNDSEWYKNTVKRLECWLRLYALCVGVTTPYNELPDAQKKEFRVRV